MSNNYLANPSASRAGLVATALVTLACSAAAQVQIYGTVDAAVGTIATQPVGAPNAAIVKTSGVHNGGLQTSYFGLKGNEDLGGGLSAKFVMEGFFRTDTGASGRFDPNPTSSGDAMWSREMYVGLAGGFGEIRLGNNGNPTWIAMLQTNALGANSVFSPAFRQLFNAGTRGLSEVDTAMVNSVRYISPVFAGFEVNVALSPDEGRGSSNHVVSLTYKNGPLLLSAATQHVGHAAPPTLTALSIPPFAANPTRRDQTMNLIGGAYSFGPARVFGQYVQVKNNRTGTTDKVPDFGVSVRLGNGDLQFAQGQDKTTGTTVAKRTTTTIGYVYNMSKRTDLYTFAMADKVSVGTANSFVVGIRHRF